MLRSILPHLPVVVNPVQHNLMRFMIDSGVGETETAGIFDLVVRCEDGLIGVDDNGSGAVSIQVRCVPVAPV